MSERRPLVEFIPEGFQVEITIFEDFIHPRGALSHQIEAHALMFYYLNARRIYEMYELNDPIVYEGQDDPRQNYTELFESIAALYGVNPNRMQNFWPMIDDQCRLMGFPTLPENPKFRYASIIQLQ